MIGKTEREQTVVRDLVEIVFQILTCLLTITFFVIRRGLLFFSVLVHAKLLDSQHRESLCLFPWSFELMNSRPTPLNRLEVFAHLKGLFCDAHLALYRRDFFRFHLGSKKFY